MPYVCEEGEGEEEEEEDQLHLLLKCCERYGVGYNLY